MISRFRMPIAKRLQVYLALVTYLWKNNGHTKRTGRVFISSAAPSLAYYPSLLHLRVINSGKNASEGVTTFSIAGDGR
jgi:hypothetical protein